jgi:methylmalonyl-CoA mutase
VLGSPTKQGEGEVVEERGASTVVREGTHAAVHAIDVHEAGGSIPLEIAVTIGRWLDALREGRREAPIALAVGTEVFVEVAKLRAIRALAQRSAAAMGHASPLRLLARASVVPHSRIEPETNALRSTLSVLASMLGGADLVAAAPYDLLSPLEGEARARASRLAGTTGLVAALESHLALPEDPLHGAYFVETLTAELMDAAWSIVRELERGGGAAIARDHWRTRLADEAKARQKSAATGKLPRVGVSRLARVEAPMLGPAHASLGDVLRDAAPFEALRDQHIARRTTILVVGDPRKTAARAEYLREILATWGAQVHLETLASASANVGLVRDDAGDAVVLCADDSDFGSLEALVRAQSKTAAVMIAGKPGQHEVSLRAAGVVAFVHLGVDLPAVARA